MIDNLLQFMDSIDNCNNNTSINSNNNHDSKQLNMKFTLKILSLLCLLVKYSSHSLDLLLKFDSKILSQVVHFCALGDVSSQTLLKWIIRKCYDVIKNNNQDKNSDHTNIKCKIFNFLKRLFSVIVVFYSQVKFQENKQKVPGMIKKNINGKNNNNDHNNNNNNNNSNKTNNKTTILGETPQTPVEKYTNLLSILKISVPLLVCAPGMLF